MSTDTAFALGYVILPLAGAAVSVWWTNRIFNRREAGKIETPYGERRIGL